MTGSTRPTLLDAAEAGLVLDLASVFPPIWAQAGAPGGPGVPGAPGAPGSGPVGSLLVIALRRWCGSLTLSPPGAAGLVSYGALAWLIGLGLLLLVAILAQGPGTAIGQVFDVAGHSRLLGAALARFRRSGRLLGIAVSATVVAWTASQLFNYSVPSGRDDMLLLTKGRRLMDVALGQGGLAALTPLRDVVGLGLEIPLLIAAAVVLFQFSTDRWGTGVRPSLSVRRRSSRSSRWSTVGWGITAMAALYRFVGLLAGSGDLPLGGCLFPEAIVVPTLMTLSDGVIVAWVLVELRSAGMGSLDNETTDVGGGVLLIPAAALACFLAFPARYLAAAGVLTSYHLPPGPNGAAQVSAFIRWLLGWGLIDIQAGALVFAGIFGAVAWSRGTLGDALRGYGRLLRAEGGHVVAAIALGGLVVGGFSALAYFVVLALPASTWALAAADSYAHYATLPVGLLLTAALVELGERSLPVATLAVKPPAEQPAEAMA